ncbi:heme exporter protein CcmD [Rhodoblastus sp.]|nr:heme exporter protein CcmD [Rhodoblastus sp.]
MKDYTFYIAAAYGFAALVVVTVIAKIMLDYRALRQKLTRFDNKERNR